MFDGYLLAYDAHCGPCRAFKRLVRFVDSNRKIQFVSLEDADAAGSLEAIVETSRYRSFHLVGRGETWSGAEALVPLVRVALPGGRALTRIIETLPGSSRAISFGYATISRLHATGTCGTVAH